MLLPEPVSSGRFLLRLSRPQDGNVACKGISFAASRNGSASLGSKTGKDEYSHPNAEGKSCFLNFTHTQLLIQGQRRRSPKVYLLVPCPISVAHRTIGTFCAELTSAPKLLKAIE